MKDKEAICSATACAASDAAPISPMTKAAALKMVTSKASVAPIGSPRRHRAPRREGSARHQRPNRR